MAIPSLPDCALPTYSPLPLVHPFPWVHSFNHILQKLILSLKSPSPYGSLSPDLMLVASIPIAFDPLFPLHLSLGCVVMLLVCLADHSSVAEVNPKIFNRTALSAPLYILEDFSLTPRGFA
jgi:hypothetical protein